MAHSEERYREVQARDAIRKALDRYPQIAPEVLALIEVHENAKEAAWQADLERLLASKGTQEGGRCPTCGQRVET